ncbi:MAG TPA: lysylphosphatidylglycerol synthase transmembrane domain-containing protein [Candidatus Baltobacterales bacterium]|nr:lysylphosphatidylglycerol synthase transmembrane domain-containing protein [Candidatus Dormibacteraeota bacterium]HUZ87263.1 lysylphosphatidylglycerol synthase transmembrane domain-containing protein [Candidatus Baltobacterales bacterium]
MGVALGVVVIAFSHPASIWASLQHVNPLSVLAALLLNIPVVGLRALRAGVVIAHLGHRIPFGSQLRTQLIGTTTSSLTPAASGDYMRAYIWRRDHGVPLRVGAAVVTFERVFSLGLMLVVAVLLITLPRHGTIGWLGVGVGLGAATIAPVVFEQIPPGLERWVLTKVTRGPLSRFAEGALEVVDNFRRLLRSPTLLAQASGLTLAVFVLSGVQLWLLLDGLDHRVPMTQAVAAYAASQAVGILSTLPFGIGTTDAVVVGVLAGYGVNLAIAATVALLLRAVATIPQALGGMIAYATLESHDSVMASGEAATGAGPE